MRFVLNECTGAGAVAMMERAGGIFFSIEKNSIKFES